MGGLLDEFKKEFWAANMPQRFAARAGGTQRRDASSRQWRGRRTARPAASLRLTASPWAVLSLPLPLPPPPPPTPTRTPRRTTPRPTTCRTLTSPPGMAAAVDAHKCSTRKKSAAPLRCRCDASARLRRLPLITHFTRMPPPFAPSHWGLHEYFIFVANIVVIFGVFAFILFLYQYKSSLQVLLYCIGSTLSLYQCKHSCTRTRTRCRYAFHDTIHYHGEHTPQYTTGNIFCCILYTDTVYCVPTRLCSPLHTVYRYGGHTPHTRVAYFRDGANRVAEVPPDFPFTLQAEFDREEAANKEKETTGAGS